MKLLYLHNLLLSVRFAREDQIINFTLHLWEIEKTSIEGPAILKPRIFGDDRGYFFESYNQNIFNELIGEEINFVQDNQSFSSNNVLRGLHFQNPPFAQGKLVRVVKGEVLDVAVDLRKNSPTYGKHISVVLNEENQLQFWVPPGFAHGFITRQPNTIFAYKCSNVYDKASEECIKWDDQTLGIDWGSDNPLVSEKDEEGKLFVDFVSQF